jgi:hypothetical protein
LEALNDVARLVREHRGRLDGHSLSKLGTLLIEKTYQVRQGRLPLIKHVSTDALSDVLKKFQGEWLDLEADLNVPEKPYIFIGVSTSSSTNLDGILQVVLKFILFN